MVGVQGFEPRVVESESTALPLGDTPVYLIFKWTIRDSNPGPTGYEPVALTNWANGPNEAPQVGLEPTTTRLTAECSTDWAIEEYIRKE